MKTLARIAAVLSSVLCFLAGLWLLGKSNFSTDDVLTVAIGLYFVGKGFFLGPMLWLTAEKCCPGQEDAPAK